LYNHGVEEYEVEYALLHSGEDRTGYQGARVSVGKTGAGRHLRVIYVPDPEPDSVFVITAYELKGKTFIPLMQIWGRYTILLIRFILSKNMNEY
jgi:hypothetical protein